MQGPLEERLRTPFPRHVRSTECKLNAWPPTARRGAGISVPGSFVSLRIAVGTLGKEGMVSGEGEQPQSFCH